LCIHYQPVRREDNEKGRNGRGKRRSENSRRALNNLRYADDTTLMTGKIADLTKLIRRLNRESEKNSLNTLI